jgi:hypothetical protein
MTFDLIEDRKVYCGTYKGFKVWSVGCMIGNNWYGDYYITIPRGMSKKQMKDKNSISPTIEVLKAYVDKHIDELNKKRQ